MASDGIRRNEPCLETVRVERRHRIAKGAKESYLEVLGVASDFKPLRLPVADNVICSIYGTEHLYLQMASPLYPSAASLMWPALIALMPRNLVEISTILAGAALIATNLVQSVCPKTLMEHLDLEIHRVDDKLRDIESNVEYGELNQKSGLCLV